MKWLITLGLLASAPVANAYDGPGGFHCGSECCRSIEITLKGLNTPKKERSELEDELVSLMLEKDCPGAIEGSPEWNECSNSLQLKFWRECPSK